MGSSFEVIADVDATEAEAPALAASIVAWLVDEGIVVAQIDQCVGGSGTGHRPGPHYGNAVIDHDDLVQGLRINGLEVTTARSVFQPVQGALGPVVCPRCENMVVLEESATGRPTAYWDRFSDALDSWCQGGSGKVQCVHCGGVIGFNDWRWIGRWPFAVGFLGFTFWNWPRLRDSFIAEIGERLDHRVVVTQGKI